MKVDLSVIERLSLEGFLPEQSSMQDMILKRDIVEKVRLTQEEITEIELKQVDNGIEFKQEKSKDKAIDFTELEINLLKDGVKKADSEKKVTLQTLSLVQKLKDLTFAKE